MTNKEKYLNAFTETFEITAEETRGDCPKTPERR